MSLELVIGIGLTAFILLYFAMNLDQEHIILKLFLVFITLPLLIVGAKATLDNNDYCTVEIANYTTVANTTTNQYERVCFDNSNNTSSIYYRGMIFLIVVFFTYVLVYITYKFLPRRYE